MGKMNGTAAVSRERQLAWEKLHMQTEQKPRKKYFLFRFVSWVDELTHD